jgi:hypothetical protein
MKKIDPKSPGQSSQSDDFCDPHGHVGAMSPGNHEGLGRTDDGSFAAMSRGGSSPDGDAMVAKYRPGGGGSGKQVASGSELNDEGDDWA